MTGVPRAIYPEKHEPLHFLAGRFMHKNCFLRHPARPRLQADIDQFNAAVERRRCVVCDKVIAAGKGGFSTQRLGPALGPHGQQNYLQFHAACLPRYAGLATLIDLVRELQREPENPVEWLAEVTRILEEAQQGRAPVGSVFFQ
jgi:hypothetical protein